MAELTGSADSAGDPWLKVDRSEHGTAVVVRAVGDLDEDNVDVLRSELVAALASVTPPAPVVVDLTEICFLGSSGLNELLAWHKQAYANGIPLRIVAAQRKVLRPIEMAGLKPVLTVYPDLLGALCS